MPDTSNDTQDNNLVFNVAINKTSPATPGDKHASKIIKVSAGDFDGCRLYTAEYCCNNLQTSQGLATRIAADSDFDKHLAEYLTKSRDQDLEALNQLYGEISSRLRQSIEHKKVIVENLATIRDSEEESEGPFYDGIRNKLIEGIADKNRLVAVIAKVEKDPDYLASEANRTALRSEIENNAKYFPDFYQGLDGKLGHYNKRYVETQMREYNKDLTDWDGKRPAYVSTRSHFDNDIVHACELPDKPGWVVRLDLNQDRPSFAVPGAQTQTGTTQLSFLANPQNSSAAASGKTGAAQVELRLDASVSFDHDRYQISFAKKTGLTLDERKNIICAIRCAVDNYPEEISLKNSSSDAIRNWVNSWIGRHGSNDLKGLWLNHASSVHLNYTQSRIPISEINEGEWSLPVFVVDNNGDKKFLTYTKISVEWAADGAKPADKSSAKPDSKTPPADTAPANPKSS